MSTDGNSKGKGGSAIAARLKALAGGGTQDLSPADRQSIQSGAKVLGAANRLAPGQVLARHYKIIKKLGEGGMGMVFEVEDLILDNRRFAIKVVPPELSRDQAAVNRLKQEALSAMELHHSNIMTVNAFEGLSEIKFLVMEYLDGPNLEVALTEKGRFTAEEIVEVAAQVCPAIDFAHSRHVVHRDIKPANLVYKVEAGKQVIKIADFGIAYQIRQSQQKVTGGVAAAGTLFYMAPEQFLGKPPTPQSDQYSLGATFYELLAGRPPLTGTTIDMVIELAKTVKPQPIDGVPDHVNAAVLKSLAKEPSQRFESCEHLRAALAGVSAPKTAIYVPTDAEKKRELESKRALERQQEQIRQALSAGLFDDDDDDEDEDDVSAGDGVGSAVEHDGRQTGIGDDAVAADRSARVSDVRQRFGAFFDDGGDAGAAAGAGSESAAKALAGQTLAPTYVPEVPQVTAQFPPALDGASSKAQLPTAQPGMPPSPAGTQQYGTPSSAAGTQQYGSQAQPPAVSLPPVTQTPLGPGRKPRQAAPVAYQQQAQQAVQGHVTPGHVTPGHVTPGHVTPGHALPGQTAPGEALIDGHDYNERRVAELDRVVSDARVAVRNMVLMGLGFIAIVAVLIFFVLM